LLAARPISAPFSYVVTPNAQFVVYAARGDRRFQTPIEQAWLAPNDSRVLARLARLLRGIDLQVCTGSDLTASLFAHTISPGDRIAVIGGDDRLAELLRTRYGLASLMQHCPPMGFIHSEAAVAECIAFARQVRARFLFIACGAPQSEQLALKIMEAGATGTGLCVGSSLLFLTGQIARAPQIYQRLGLESLFRLAQEPNRLWRRFLTGQLPVLWLAVREAIKREPITPPLPAGGAEAGGNAAANQISTVIQSVADDAGDAAGDPANAAAGRPADQSVAAGANPGPGDQAKTSA
jgi:exopolysaccharide biosynthesis WecB/TagA/CpsF family protein